MDVKNVLLKILACFGLARPVLANANLKLVPWQTLTLSTNRYDLSGLAGRRFVTLDAMRGVAAISVMFFHYLDFTPYYMSKDGIYAVDFFFVLSGIVLTHAYGAKISKNMTLTQFMRSRMIRLYPFIFLSSILSAIVYLFLDLWFPITNMRPIDYSLAILSGLVILPYPLIGGLIKNALFPTNIPEWSLFFEILASMTLFFVIKKRIKSHYIVIVAFIMLIFALLWYKHLNLGVDTSTILGGFPRTAFAFFAGVLIYQIFIDVGHVNVVGITMYSVYIDLKYVKFIRNSWLILLLTTIVFCLPPAPNLCTKIITGPFLVLLLPYLVLSGLANDDNSECRRVFVWLGRVSYGIYAIHWPVYHLIVVFLNRTAWADEIRDAPLILACGVAAVVIAVAHLLTLVIDEPIRRWLSSSRNRAPASRTIATEG